MRLGSQKDSEPLRGVLGQLAVRRCHGFCICSGYHCLDTTNKFCKQVMTLFTGFMVFLTSIFGRQIAIIAVAAFTDLISQHADTFTVVMAFLFFPSSFLWWLAVQTFLSGAWTFVALAGMVFTILVDVSYVLRSLE
jgi:hypothetical protein